MAYLTRLIIILIITALAPSCNYSEDGIKVDNWEILYEQDKNLSHIIKKSEWQPLSIPATFKLPHTDIKDFRYVWLRGRFEIKDNPDKYYGLTIGKVVLTEETYLNNKLIGKTLKKRINWSPLPRNYVFPEKTLKKGQNNIHIRLGLYSKYDGGILNDIYILDEDSFDLNEQFENLIFSHIPAGIVVMSSLFILPILIIFIYNRRDKLILYGLLALIIYLCHILTQLTTNRMISFELLFAIKTAITPLFVMIFILILQSIYKIYLTAYNRIILSILFTFIIIIFAFYNSNFNLQISIVIRILSLCIALPFFVFMIYRLNSISKDRFLLLMIITISVIVSAIIIFEAHFMYRGGRYTDVISIFSPISLLTLSAILLSREVMKRRIELEHFYKTLKKGEGHEKELPITDTSEEKLKRVIDFIHENYTSDLSREGLAAAVGINTNYMGSLFKSYTGKTINEYINQLRIDEAIKQLKKKDIRITDIAFSIGFESLVTFNRVFKKIMGTTPTEYRENII